MVEAEKEAEKKQGSGKENKGFGEGIEVVKDAHPEGKEEKDIEINFDFGKVFSFFKGKEGKNSGQAAVEAKPQQAGHENEHRQPSHHAHQAAQATEHKMPHHPHQQQHQEAKETKEDAEIDIGKLTSGIKGFFRGKKEGSKKTADSGGKEEGRGEGDEVSLDFGSIADFFRRKGSSILLILGILIVVGLTADVRLQPSQMHFAEDWARNSVSNTIQSDIQSTITAQYPNLPEARKNQILSDEVSKARNGKTYVFKSGQYAGQQIDINGQIKSTAEFIRDFYRDENGRPYSPDIDPYYWYRYAKNIVETGHIGDEIRDGMEWDNRQVAPEGRPVLKHDNFFPYFIAYLYKFTRFFNPSTTLWAVQTTVYPVLVSGLTVLLIFLIGRKLAGSLGGFFGALMAGLHVAYVNRTIHGDNDTIVVLFTVLVLWLFVQAIYEKNTIRMLVYATLAGFSVGLFNVAWGGWWFIFLFIMAAAAAAISVGIAVTIAKQLAENASIGLAKTAKLLATGEVGKRFIMPTAAFFVASGIFITILPGVNSFYQVPSLVLGIQTLKAAVSAESFWPNVLTTVAELNEGNFNQVVSSITPSIFWLSALSAALLAAVAIINFGFFKNMLKKVEAKEEKALYATFFAALVIVWFIGTIHASTKGIRFVLLLAPMAGLGFGITLGLVSELIKWVNENFLKINKIAVIVTVFVIMGTATYSSDVIRKAYSVANNDVPIVNDAWYDSLTAIKQDSDPVTKSAIITSWWDFGHHFKAIADRKVTFDGTTQQYPPAHWVGKFFMTKDEAEAAGILRMLDCGSNRAFDEVYNVTSDFAGSIRILNKLTATPSRSEAMRILTDGHGFTAGQAERVLNYTHCNPPEAYVIASDDMIGKSGVWGHFGSWDFEKGIIWQTLRGKSQKEAVAAMQERFNYSEEKAKAVYSEMARIKDDREANSWIAPWPSYSGEMSGCSILVSAENEQEKIVRCGNGLIVNLTENEAYFPTQEGNALHPISFVYMTNQTGTEELIEKVYTNNTVPQQLSVILVPQGQWAGNSYTSYYAAVASPEQAAGMFTRMFFMEGKGLRHFKLLTHQRGLTGTNVYVYKAQWDTLG